MSKTSQTELWEILVPCRMRNKPVRVRHHKEWDKYVRRITGGLTILKVARGQWIEPESNELYEERMIPVRIACTEKQIGRIIDFTMMHYDQLAVMAYCVSTKVIIKHKDEPKSCPECGSLNVTTSIKREVLLWGRDGDSFECDTPVRTCECGFQWIDNEGMEAHDTACFKFEKSKGIIRTKFCNEKEKQLWEKS